MIQHGSPPQVRGSDSPHALEQFLRRFTPAGAGIGGQQARFRLLRSVHPRRCGDRGDFARCVSVDYGSPPQVRGSGSPAQNQHQLQRFTPAGAGIGAKSLAIVSLAPVHPRRCGDRAQAAFGAISGDGSPPQVRGSGLFATMGGTLGRFTPAGAGIGAVRHHGRHAWAVHPRRCGDRASIREEMAELAGSPPQVRGSATSCAL